MLIPYVDGVLVLVDGDCGGVLPVPRHQRVVPPVEQPNMVIKHFHPGSIESPLLCTWSSPSQCIWSLPYCVPGVPLTVSLEYPSICTWSTPHCVPGVFPYCVPGVSLIVYLWSTPHCVPGVPLTVCLEFPSLCTWSLPHYVPGVPLTAVAGE